MRDKKAVSEVVGALMVISLIVTTAGIIYIISNPFLLSAQDNVKFRKAFFDLLELKEKIDNVKSGFQFNGTYTLRMAGVSFTFENRPILTINGNSTEISSIRIIGRGWELYYENGAIIEKRLALSRMLHFPKMYYDPETDTLTMPVIMFTGNTSLGGEGNVVVNFKLNNVVVGKYQDAKVSITTSNAEAWKKFFDKINLPSSYSSNSVQFNVSNLVITVYEVDVR